MILFQINRNGVNVEGAAHKQVVNLIKLSDDTLKYVINQIEIMQWKLGMIQWCLLNSSNSIIICILGFRLNVISVSEEEACKFESTGEKNEN